MSSRGRLQEFAGRERGASGLSGCREPAGSRRGADSGANSGRMPVCELLFTTNPRILLSPPAAVPFAIWHIAVCGRPLAGEPFFAQSSRGAGELPAASMPPPPCP